MVSGLVRQLESSGETEVATSTIGGLVMEALRGLDPVAYVRFASVYRDFREAADFQEVLSEIAGEPVPTHAAPASTASRSTARSSRRRRSRSTSVMIEKFAIVSGMVTSEFLDLNHTSKFTILVSLMIPKFALGPGGELWRTSESGH